MLFGVIDIGTNTTRLLVAEVIDGRLVAHLERRHFIAPATDGIDALVPLVAEEAASARLAGADNLLVVGTAPLRRLPDARRLRLACERAGAGSLRILSEREEAELTFLGATGFATEELPSPVAVVDVGGGSTEIIVGSPGETPDWWASRPVGSRSLTERAFLSDPPSHDQLAAARNAASRRLVHVEPPPCELALVVGGGSASLRHFCGGRVDRGTVAARLGELEASSSAQLSERLGLASQRVRLLPAALIILEAVCDLLPEPLRFAHGGVREGLVLARAREHALSGGEG